MVGSIIQVIAALVCLIVGLSFLGTAKRRFRMYQIDLNVSQRDQVRVVGLDSPHFIASVVTGIVSGIALVAALIYGVSGTTGLVTGLMNGIG